MITSQFIAVGVVLLVGLILLMGVSAGNPTVPLMLAAFPLCVYLVNRPDFWLAVLVAISGSRLTFPGAPENLNTYQVLSALFVGFLVLYRMMHPVGHRKSPVRKYVFAFAVVLLAVGLRSGMGMRVLGSDMWGGSPYATLIIACLLLLSADLVVLSPRMWRNALIAMCLLTFLPVVAQSLYVFSGGQISLQYAFIQPKGFIVETLTAVSSDSGIARFSTDYSVTLLYLPLLLFANPMRGKNAVVTTSIFLISLVVAGLSGSRYSIFVVIGYVFFWSLLGGPRIFWGRTFGVVMAALVALAIAAAFAQHFPAPIQRSLSFVPWADVSQRVRLDALGTTTWRIDVWTRAIHEDLPRYWLTGRGFAFNPRDYEALRRLGLEVREWAFVTGSYHSGPLSLIINLGITGFVVGLCFFWTTFRTHFRILRGDFQDPHMARMYRLVLAMFANQSFLFLTVGGDVQNYFPTFLFLAMLLEGLAKTKEVSEESAVAVSPEPTPAIAVAAGLDPQPQTSSGP